jgi:hypothetical protein
VLIAACYVLHRLSTPRHPLEALSRLIVLSKTHAWRLSHAFALYFCQTMMSSIRSVLADAFSSVRTDPSFTMSNSPGFRPARNLFFLIAPPWWSQTGSNRRPHACKARALPTELWPRGSTSSAFLASPKELVGPGRLELPTSRLSGVRSNQLSYGPKDGASSPLKPMTLGLAIAPRASTEPPSEDGAPTGGDEGKRNEDGGDLHL